MRSGVRSGNQAEAAAGSRGDLGIESIVNLLAPAEANRFFETPDGPKNLRFSGELPGPILRMEDGWQRVRIALHAPGTDNFGCADRDRVGIGRRIRARVSGFTDPGALANQHGKGFFRTIGLADRVVLVLFDNPQILGESHSSSIHCASQWKPVRAAISMGSDEDICANFPSRWFRLLRGECAGRSRECPRAGVARSADAFRCGARRRSKVLHGRTVSSRSRRRVRD